MLKTGGGPSQEYFYLELPSADQSHRRFLYIKEAKDGFFPMRFGLEVFNAAKAFPLSYCIHVGMFIGRCGDIRKARTK